MLSEETAKSDKLPQAMSLKSADVEDEKDDLDNESVWVMRRQDANTLQLTTHPCLKQTAQNGLHTSAVWHQLRLFSNLPADGEASPVGLYFEVFL